MGELVHFLLENVLRFALGGQAEVVAEHRIDVGAVRVLHVAAHEVGSRGEGVVDGLDRFSLGIGGAAVSEWEVAEFFVSHVNVIRRV